MEPSVPLPQTEVINRMELGEQCWAAAVRANYVDVGKITNTSFAAHILIMLMLFVLTAPGTE